MEAQNSLGIYLSKETATVVYLNAGAKNENRMDCFSVRVEQIDEQEQTAMQCLAERIAQGCTERKWKFTETSVALDCTLFMQHSVHSEFRDPRQIAATVKFDTEEALATDITRVALAFEIVSSDETGSELTVFTAERGILSNLLTALQHHNLDPVTIEPDIRCLTRFIHRQVPSDGTEQDVLFALLSRHCGYLIIPVASSGEGSRKAPIFRTFLLSATQDRANSLAREILITKALVRDSEPLRALRVFDSTQAVVARSLQDKLGMEVDQIDLFQNGTGTLQKPDCDTNPIDGAIAYGAALTHSQKEHKVDFRNDFSPFLGKKLRLQKALKFASVSVTVLLIAVGVYFHTQLLNTNKEKDRIRFRFARDYGDVTLERLSSDVSVKKAVSNLGSLLRRIEYEKKGLHLGQESISSNLTLIFMAFNSCAAETDLKINSLTITDENIIVAADVSNRQNRQKLFDAVEKVGLKIMQQGYESSGQRESFHITVRPQKVSEKTS